MSNYFFRILSIYKHKKREPIGSLFLLMLFVVLNLQT
jgi:hypothetical protein